MLFLRRIANIEIGLFLLALLLSGGITLASVTPANDAVTRYAPMADAFAQGNWHYAFHPRVGVWFPVFTGILTWVLGCRGIAACQITAILFFSLSVFPLYRLFKLLWDEKIAATGTLLYVLCSHLLRYPADGVRDNGKTLAMAMIALGIVTLYRDRKSIRGGLELIVGMWLLTILRGEGALVALFCGAAGIYLVRDWKRVAGGTAIFFLLLAPQLFYNYCAIGYPVVELRHGVLLDKMNVPPASASIKIPETAE